MHVALHVCSTHHQAHMCAAAAVCHETSQHTSMTSIKWPGASRQAALKPTTLSCMQALSSSISCRNLAYTPQKE
jgi:hypothetical protein